MYLNVKKGLEKIYLSKILDIVTAVSARLAVIFSAFAIGSLLISGFLATLIAFFATLFGIVFFASAIAAFVLGLMGIIDASHDEPSYNGALTWLVVGIAVTLIGNIFESRSGWLWSAVFGILNAIFKYKWANNIASFLWGILKIVFVAAQGFASFMVMYKVIDSTVTVAKAVNNFEVSNLGPQRIEMFKKLFIIAVGLKVVFFIPGIGSICGFAGTVVEVIIFFMYLSFIGKAKVMV